MQWAILLSPILELKLNLEYRARQLPPWPFSSEKDS